MWHKRGEGVLFLNEGKKERHIDREHGLAKAAGRCTSSQNINMQAGSKLHSFQSEDELLELDVERRSQ